MSLQSLALTGGPVTFDGAVSLEVTDTYVHPWRLNFDRIDLFEPGLINCAATPAGVRATFVSDTSCVVLTVPPHATAAEYDLLIDGAFHQRASLQPGDAQVTFDDLPAGAHRIEVWLPQRSFTQIRTISIDADAVAYAWLDKRPKWTVYGSSITHCGSASGPSETWPAIVANRYDLNLTCLGYGGNCHMEPMVTRMIRDLPADYISTCVGINILGGATLSPRTFRAAVIGMVQTIREKHPVTPMVVVSPICNPPREEAPNAVDLSLVKMREIIAGAVDTLRGYGDEHLIYQDGLALFGPDKVHHMPDQLHPDAEGTRALGKCYGDLVMPKLGLKA